MGHNKNNFQNAFLDGVISQAHRLDYDVAIFSLFTLSRDISRHQVGEENIFSLIPYDQFTGFVFFESTFWVERLKQQLIMEMRKKTNGNVVFLDSTECYNFTPVVSDDDTHFGQMTSHLIEKHGLKKIYCLTGHDYSGIAHIRLNSYRRAMKEHGLEVPDEYVFWGDFWVDSAHALAEKIINGQVERPEAVVCANDASAIALTNMLVEHGIRVPEEIAVTGYDFFESAWNNTPSVTSYARPDQHTGARCVCEIHKKATGEVIEPYCPDTGVFIAGESCGCRKETEFIRSYGRAARLRSELREDYDCSGMQEILMASETYEDFIRHASSMVYLLPGYKRYAICLNDSWNEFHEHDDMYLQNGYADTMFESLLVDKTNGISMERIPFASKDLFPPGMLEEKQPVACYFTPLHFGDRCFGYEVIQFRASDFSPDLIYGPWTGNLNIALEYVRVQERLRIMYDKVCANSMRDGMTGIYNRKGYDSIAPDLFAEAQKKQGKLLLVIADLDNLKYINDTYGHHEGDNALTVLAQSLQSCCGNSEYCARTGGDEFIIIGCYDYEEESIAYYRSRIRGYLSRYNANSGKPYKVETSLGFFCDVTEPYETLDACVKLADAQMYIDKMTRKKGRGFLTEPAATEKAPHK